MRIRENVCLLRVPLFVFSVLFLVGTVDVAMLYLVGESVARHSLVQIGILSMVKAAIWALPFAAASCLLNDRGRWCCLLLLFPIFVVAIEAYARINFHRGIGGEWYTLLVTSSPAEIGDFFHSMLTPQNGVLCLVLLLMVIGVVAFLAHGIPCRRQMTLSSRLFVGLVLLFCFAILKAYVTIGLDCTYPFFIVNSLNNRASFLSLRNCIDPCPQITFSLSDIANTRPLVIIVIGESASRNYWSQYGYPRMTTPNVEMVSADNKAVFYDVQTVYPVTTKVLRCLVTDATAEHLDITCTLPYIVGRCGYESVLISNQGHWGGIDSYESMLFALCGRKIYIADLGLPKPTYDDAVLPVVEEEVRDAPGGKVMFVHLMGSHTPMDARYPKSREVFPLDSVPPQGSSVSPDARRTINAYDNSIAFTDSLLGEMIRILEASKRPAILFYVSDHGESPGGKSWRIISDPDCWEVPMFAYWTDGYQKQFPEIADALKRAERKRLQTDWLFYGIVEICGITGDFKRELSFLSDNFQSNRKRRFERKEK